MEERVFYRTGAVAPRPPAASLPVRAGPAEGEISVAKLMTRAPWSRFTGMETVVSLVACAASISLSGRIGGRASAVQA
ncbi:hypothetical protein CBM2587_A60017 [Cupriavidus taiwanensis]|uniref:Uncharacterized protein n=1 Tax=Cupriavidus taiwanensis TaxID=164546 RepID=A0A375BVT7_9BURK|nr:hypothetical protein CBM2587_A60017 [Cupriavidus taiwanensis]